MFWWSALKMYSILKRRVLFHYYYYLTSPCSWTTVRHLHLIMYLVSGSFPQRQIFGRRVGGMIEESLWLYSTCHLSLSTCFAGTSEFSPLGRTVWLSIPMQLGRLRRRSVTPLRLHRRGLDPASPCCSYMVPFLWLLCHWPHRNLPCSLCWQMLFYICLFWIKRHTTGVCCHAKAHALWRLESKEVGDLQRK